MSGGFVKLQREGIELLLNSPPAFILLTLIALRARRTETAYSVQQLKVNEAFIGDYKIIGLTRQQYRDAMDKLEKNGLVNFKRGKRGTIAVLTSKAIYDINAESEGGSDESSQDFQKTMQEQNDNQIRTTQEPSDLSMENRIKEPSEEPTQNHSKTTEEPLTKNGKRKEKKEATATSQSYYKSLEGLGLSNQEKQALMRFTEHQVDHAVEFVKRKQDVESVIGMLIWVCQEPILPELPREKERNLTPQQRLAFEYNQFLNANGYSPLAKKNEELIPNKKMLILASGRSISISLCNALSVIQEDFRKSKYEILKNQQMDQGL